MRVAREAVIDGFQLGNRILRRKWKGIAVLVVAAVLLNLPVVAAADVSSLLREGDKFLVAGRSAYGDALSKYSAAVALAPQDPKVLFRRAELLFMMKRWDEAQVDLEKVLAADPKHKKALERRATLRASRGDLSGASKDYAALSAVQTAASNAKKALEASEKATRTAALGTKWDALQRDLRNAMDLDTKLAKNAECVGVLQDLIQAFAKDSTALRLRRAECAVAAHQQQAATEELKYILVKEPHNLQAIALNARALRQLGSIDGAKTEVRRCLSLDPEDEGCVALHKSLKSYGKLTKELEALINRQDWSKALEFIDQVLKTEADPPNLSQLWQWKCEGYLATRDTAPGHTACAMVLKLENGDGNPAMSKIHINVANLHVLDDNLDAAEKALQDAVKVNEQSQEVRDFRNKLQQLKDQASRKDYYKILGVKRTASDKEIRRAYKKLAKKLHPDQLRAVEMTEKEREKTDEQFRDINEAKTVLLDEETRKRFDNGEDVTKPAGQQQQHGGNPFPGGFSFGGGGGFQQGGPGGFSFRFG